MSYFWGLKLVALWSPHQKPVVIECVDQTGQDKAKILIGQAEILSKPLSSSSFNSESNFFILLCFYFLWFQMVSISCLSSCLLLKNLKHLSLPIMNKQVEGHYACVSVCASVCVSLSMQYVFSWCSNYLINIQV